MISLDHIYSLFKKEKIRSLSIHWKGNVALKFNTRWKVKKNIKCLDNVAIAKAQNLGLVFCCCLFVCLFVLLSNLWPSKITKLSDYTKVIL